ncbi:phosphatase PAP2 family protein [Wukongibacter baidiensis]|uniref:phosphatase PAP2 family protein n=1 Tax=Wukongibacter baidiensis TaxID=1723361 RepID=UPI003D7F9D5A
MLDIILSIDKWILEFIQTYMHNPLLDKIMPFITKLGNWGVIWIIISIIFILNKKYRKAGILAICSLLIVVILGEGLIKNIVARPRPFMEIPNIDLLISKPTSYSFPSGHTASSFAAAMVYAKMIDDKRIVIPLVLLASMIAFSRLYLMVHYPTDILGGIILGLLSTKLAYVSCIIYKKL